MLQADVVIVGAGVAGLSTAVALLDAGLRIVVIEAGGEIGGRARSWTDDITGDVVDIGPHVVTAHHHHFLRLLRELGTEERLVWQKPLRLARLCAPDDRFIVRIPPLWPPLHLGWMGMRVRQLGWAQKLSNWRVGLLAMSLRKECLSRLDRMSAEDLLRRLGADEASLDWMWHAVSMTLLNVPLPQLSATALMRVLRQVAGHSDLRFAMPGVGLGDLFVPEACRRIEAQGGRVLTGIAATGIECDESSRFDRVRLADGRCVRAPDAVIAVEPQALPRLLPEAAMAPSQRSALASLPASPYLSVLLWFDRRFGDERVLGRMWGRRTRAFDFYDLARIRPDLRGRGSIVAANLIDPPQELGRSDETAIASTLRELAQMLPEAGRARLLHHRVHRIPMAVPSAVVGSENARPPTCTTVRGLHLASDWCATDLPASMESAARAGFMAAAGVASDRGIALRLSPHEVPEPRGLCAWAQRWWPDIGLHRLFDDTRPKLRA